MLTVTNINQQSPNFQARVKMSKTGKIGAYLKENGINSNKALLGATALSSSGAGAIMASPNLISAPVAAKYGILGGMGSTMGLIVRNLFKKGKFARPIAKANIAEKASEIAEKTLAENANIKFSDDIFGKFELTKKGLAQYRDLKSKYLHVQQDYKSRDEIINNRNFNHCRQDYIDKNEAYANLAEMESELNLLKQLGELP